MEIPLISVVIPIYNEEGNLRELYRRLTDVMEKICKVEKDNSLPRSPSLKPNNHENANQFQIEDSAQHIFNLSYEIAMVDDGSTDKSWNIISELHYKDPRVKGIRFSRNFGHHIAITAGIDNAKGNYVVLMDGDLQDPPEEIPKLYDKAKNGYDVVYAIRETRKDSLIKKASSKFFHGIFQLLANVKIDPNAGAFRILTRKAVDNLKACRERSRFLIGLISWIGFSQIGVPTTRDARYAGKTKYNLFKSVILAINAITSFSYFPLRIATYFGSIVAIVSFIIALYMLIRKAFLGIPVLGYASIIVSILFIGGIQLIIIGIMGEYIGRIYSEIQNRPFYIINETLGIK